jgi:long-chain fatty acid transport protein
MKHKRAISLLTVCFAILSLMFAQHTFAGGLYISEVNSPASLGTAGVNNVVNNLTADAAYTNPAGMTGITEDLTLMPGFQIMIPKVEFDASIAEAGGGNGGNASAGDVIAIPGFNAVKVLSDKWRLGLAITAPLGGGVHYGDNFAGRYSATRAVLSGLGITPSVAYKINDALSLGVGITAIYTEFDQDIAVRQQTPAGTPLRDGRMSINQIDDWSGQGILGLTWQITDKAMLGVVYRSKSEVELDGDLDFYNIENPLVNNITSRLDRIEVDFDYAQLVAVGLAYDVSDRLRLIVDFDWEDWSEFSDNHISIEGGAVTKDIDRNWDDTWHVGAALIYKADDSALTAGVAYDSSPVDDEDRTFDIPIDEQVKFGISYSRHIDKKISYGYGFGYTWLGDGKIDQTSQGVRVKGEFDTNYFVSIGGNLRYHF